MNIGILNETVHSFGRRMGMPSVWRGGRR